MHSGAEDAASRMRVCNRIIKLMRARISRMNDATSSHEELHLAAEDEAGGLVELHVFRVRLRTALFGTSRREPLSKTNLIRCTE